MARLHVGEKRGREALTTGVIFSTDHLLHLLECFSEGLSHAWNCWKPALDTSKTSFELSEIDARQSHLLQPTVKWPGCI